MKAFFTRESRSIWTSQGYPFVPYYSEMGIYSFSNDESRKFSVQSALIVLPRKSNSVTGSQRPNSVQSMLQSGDTYTQKEYRSNPARLGHLLFSFSYA